MYAPSTDTTTIAAEPRGRPSLPDSEMQDAISFFVAQRPRLFRIAYRITGGDTLSAEDVVQEVWLRWQRTDRGVVRNPAAFLTTTATRLAINVIQSAHHRHEAPSETIASGPGDAAQDPSGAADRSAAVSQALALLMGRLTRAELAALLLRGAFDYPYADISRLLCTSVANARQLVSRARSRVERDVARSAVEPRSHRRLVAAFLIASRTGELDGLERLLVTNAPSAATRSRPSGRTALTPQQAELDPDRERGYQAQGCCRDELAGHGGLPSDQSRREAGDSFTVHLQGRGPRPPSAWSDAWAGREDTLERCHHPEAFWVGPRN